MRNNPKENAIPGLDPFLMGDNFQKFMKSLTYPVAGYEYIHKVFTIESAKETFFVLIFLSNVILYYE